MSKNTNIADLINYISVDGSGNVVLSTGGQVATQSYVTTAVSNLVNSAPTTLDTLNELAAALGNDANFATTVTNSIATKLPLSGGTLTGFTRLSSDNNYFALRRTAINKFIGVLYQTAETNYWFVGLRETGTNNYIVYNEILGTDAFSISLINNSATFSGAYGTQNGININGTTYATLNSNRGAFSASAGVNYGSVGVQKWFTGIYENTDNFGFYNTTLNGFPIIVSTSGLTTFTKSDSSYGQVRLIGSSVESSIGFRYPSDGDATSWVIGKGAGTGSSHFGFYYGGTRMVLSPSGNLGIGVDAPTYGKLQVESTGTTAYFQGGNGGYAALAFSGNNGTLVGVLTTFGGLIYLGRSNGTLGNAFGSQTDIVIGSTGNVGIGQTPLQALGTTLTVNGTIVSQTGAGGGNYNENFRANRTGNGYSAIAMGGANGTVSGTGVGVWTMAATPVGLGYRFDFDYAGSTVIMFATNGSITNSTGSYGTISDIRLKENITDASPKLENINKLKVRNFNLIGEDLKQIGFIAQEIEEVFPNMVDTNTKGIKSVKTTVLIPMLVKSVQELKAENDELRAILNRNNII